MTTHARPFESVAIGQEVQLHRGPLTSAHLMRWSAAMENWHKIHYDAPFSIGNEKLPGLLVNGSFKQQFIMTMLKDWAGNTGWAWKVSFQFRAMNLVGETLAVWAKVSGKRALAEFGLVDLAVGIRNDKEQESTPGTAVVALPFAAGAAVPYPFVAPQS